MIKMKTCVIEIMKLRGSLIVSYKMIMVRGISFRYAIYIFNRIFKFFFIIILDIVECVGYVSIILYYTYITHSLNNTFTSICSLICFFDAQF